MTILSIVLECIDQAVKKLEALKVDPKDIVAVGVSNQRETTVLWDKLTGLPYYNAIGGFKKLLGLTECGNSDKIFFKTTESLA